MAQHYDRGRTEYDRILPTLSEHYDGSVVVIPLEPGDPEYVLGQTPEEARAKALSLYGDVSWYQRVVGEGSITTEVLKVV